MKNIIKLKLPQHMLSYADLRRMCEEGYSIEEMRRETGAGFYTIKRLLQERHLSLKRRKEIQEAAKRRRLVKEYEGHWPEKEEIEECLESGLTFQETVETRAIHFLILKGACKAYDLPFPPQRPSQERLQKEYAKEKKALVTLAGQFGVEKRKVLQWLKEDQILLRDAREEKELELRAGWPSRERVQKYILTQHTLEQTADRFGYSTKYMRTILTEYQLPMLRRQDIRKKMLLELLLEENESQAENKLFTLKERLDEIHRTMFPEEIKAKLLEGETCCRMYLQNLNNLLFFLHRERQKVEERKKECPQKFYVETAALNLSGLQEWYRANKGLTSAERAHKKIVYTEKMLGIVEKKYTMQILPVKKIIDTPPSEVVSLSRNHQSARDLSLLTLVLGPDGRQIEDVLMELYGARFKSKDELHEQLQNAKDELLRIFQEGTTNLGWYIGPYTVVDRRMAPAMFGKAMQDIPIEKATPSIERILLRVGHGIYDPQFNQSPQDVIGKIQERVVKSEGFAQKVYRVMRKNYQRTLDVARQLREIEEAWKRSSECEK